jgi:hypothetical protein
MKCCPTRLLDRHSVPATAGGRDHVEIDDQEHGQQDEKNDANDHSGLRQPPTPLARLLELTQRNDAENDADDR